MGLFGRKETAKKENALTLYCSAVIAAAGSSERMGADKLFYRLDGIPVLARTLMVFQRALRIDEIVVVTREDRLTEVGELCREYGVTKATRVVIGGETRTESVLKGLAMVSEKAKLVAIHDGARPLVTELLINHAVAQAERFNAAVPFVPVNDTVKERSGAFVSKTLPRDSLAAVQTPQAFNKELIAAALISAGKNGLKLTDEASAVEAMGAMVHLFEGSRENIKLTTPLDLIIAEAILKSREAQT